MAELEPAAVRLQEGWPSRLLDVPGRVAVADFAAVRPTQFAKTEEGWWLRSRCRECKVDVLLPLFGEADGRAVDEGMLSPFAVWVAARAVCEPCIVKAEAAEEKALKRAGVDDRLAQSGLPAGMASEVSWESLIVDAPSPEERMKRERAIEACREWSTDKAPVRGVLLWGPPGSGKTRLAATTARARLEHSPVRWVSVAVLMAELAGGWNDDDRKAALKVLTSKSVAVLDDFDKVNPTPGVLAQVFAALDKREQAGTSLVVTTNLKPSELKKKMGDVFVSRLLGMCRVFEYPGPDRRLELGR